MSECDCDCECHDLVEDHPMYCAPSYDARTDSFVTEPDEPVWSEHHYDRPPVQMWEPNEKLLRVREWSLMSDGTIVINDGSYGFIAKLDPVPSPEWIAEHGGHA